MAFEHYLWKEMDECHFKITTVLCRQGHITRDAWFVVRGFITLSYVDENGQKHVMRIYRENRICGLISFILQRRSLYTIEASKDAMLLSISYEALAGLYKMDPRMELFVLKASMEYEHYKEQFRENLLFGKSAEEKVAEFYSIFKALLNTRRVILDEDVAWYLHISVRALRLARTAYRKNK